MVDSFGNLEKALEAGDLKSALTCLQSLSSSPEHLQLLKDHTVKDLPILHYLARLRFRTSVQVEEDRELVDSLINFYVERGSYQIDKKSDKYSASKRASLGFTALLAAIEQGNKLVLECLLKNGANPDLQDSSGYSPLHWAVIVGDLWCFEKLIYYGASTMTKGDGGTYGRVHPILHTAVDEGRTEMVLYLLNSGVMDDINEQAVYRGVMSESAFTQFPSRYDSNPEMLETVDQTFTALGRAVRMRRIKIIEMLLKMGAKLSGMEELHFLIMEGDTEVAFLLKKYFTDDELMKDKIGSAWALHCLHPSSFQDEKIEWTIDLICEYVDAGWDVNEVSPKISVCREKDDKHQVLEGCTLLHVACMYKGSGEVIRCLVQEGADVNKRTGGGADLEEGFYPLQLLLQSRQWDSVFYLIKEVGADLSLVGDALRELMRGLAEKETVLEKLDLEALGEVLKLFVVEGGFNCNERPNKSKKDVLEAVEPEHLIFYVLDIDFKNKSDLLLRTFLGFSQCRLNVRGVDGRKEGLNPVEYVMTLWNNRCLQQDDMKCWRTNSNGREGGEAEEGPYCCSHVVKLLVTMGGVDCSSLRVGARYKYHFGYKKMLQMLVCAGAEIEEEFWREQGLGEVLGPICHKGYWGTRGFKQELEELRRWVEGFQEKNGKGRSLRQICR